MKNPGLVPAAEIVPGLLARTHDFEQGLKFESFADIKIDGFSRSLVDGILDFNSFGLLVGESNVGKTFVALDLALSIARGRPWFGKKVEQGVVLYIAAEGGGNIKKRIAAYRQENDLANSSVPFLLAYGSVDLLDPTQSLPDIIKATHDAEKIFGAPIHLVVIDTLNRSLSGGDENSSTDMGTFVKNIDILRQSTSAAIFVVHHTGKDKKKGARGHSLLKAALDTELSLTKNRQSFTITVTKQRDYEAIEPMSFNLKSVELPVGNADKIVTSCVLQSLFSTSEPNAQKTELNRVPLNALGVLKSLSKEGSQSVLIEDWREAFIDRYYAGKARQTRSNAFLNAKDTLFEQGHIEIQGDNVKVST